MALLLNAGDTVSRSYSYTQPSPLHPSLPQGTGERTGNLFDKTDATQFYYNTNLATSSQWDNFGTGVVIRIPCDVNTTYTISCNVDTTVWRVSTVATDNTPAPGYSVPSFDVVRGKPVHGVYTFTTQNNAKYILFQIGSSVFDAGLNVIMLNLGSTALPYEPYGYKIPISSANTTTPIYLGAVQTTRKIRKWILAGNESLLAEGLNRGTYRYRVIRPVGERNMLSNPENCVCTHYEYTQLPYPEKPCITIPSNTFVRVFTLYETLEEFRAFLQAQNAAGTPVTLWYILENEETAIVNEPLMRIGDYADEVSNVSIPVAAGGDTLSVDTTVQPSEVTVNYKGWHPVADVHERTNGAWT